MPVHYQISKVYICIVRYIYAWERIIRILFWYSDIDSEPASLEQESLAEEIVAAVEDVLERFNEFE